MFRNWAEARGLSSSQIQALLFLAHGRPGVCTVGGVADRLLCSAATASVVVDALERKGLASRAADPEDRRKVTVALTQQGQATAAEVEGVLDELEAIVASLPPQAQEELHRSLQQVVRALAERGHVRVYEMCWNCGFFRPHAHPDLPETPHHCAFMDAPLPEAHTFKECPDFVPKEDLYGLSR
jgi:DNA-binding MarR family transcriptional regulator